MSALIFWIITLVVSTVYGGPTPEDPSKSTDAVETNMIDVNSFAKCSYSEGFTGIINCAATRALKVLQHTASSDSIEILPGVVLTSDNTQERRKGKSLENEVLPTDPKEKTERLLNLIIKAATEFFSGRTLKIKLPQVNSEFIARAIEEGRGKMKKFPPFALGIGIKLVVLKVIVILGLGFMALKALLISKVALVLAVIGAFQTLFNGGLGFKNMGGGPMISGQGWISGWGGNSPNYGPAYGPPNYNPGWTTNNIGGWGNSQYPYARSIDNVADETTPQELAYSKQKA